MTKISMHWSKSSARKTRKQKRQFTKRDNPKLNTLNIKRDASFKSTISTLEQAFLQILPEQTPITNQQHPERPVQFDFLQLERQEAVEPQEWPLLKYQPHQEHLNLVHAIKIRQVKWIRLQRLGCKTNLWLPRLRSDNFNVSTMEAEREPVLV